MRPDTLQKFSLIIREHFIMEREGDKWSFSFRLTKLMRNTKTGGTETFMLCCGINKRVYVVSATN